MKTLDELSKKIHSLEELKNIVRAMKALSSANIHQYEKAVSSLSSYEETVLLSLKISVLLSNKTLKEDYIDSNKKLLIVFGSDVGLCGGFNFTLAEKVSEYIKVNADKQIKIITSGNKLNELLIFSDIEIEKNFSMPISIHGVNSLIQAVLIAINQYLDHDILIFNHFYDSHLSSSLRSDVMYPIDKGIVLKINDMEWPSKNRPISPISLEQLLKTSLQEFFYLKLYQACIHSLACEHTARLTSMKQAEKKIRKKLSETISEFQQTNQALITDELMMLITNYGSTLKNE